MEPCSKAQKHLMGVRISFKVNNKGTRKTSTGAVSYLVLTVIYQTRLKLMHETNRTWLSPVFILDLNSFRTNEPLYFIVSIEIKRGRCYKVG